MRIEERGYCGECYEGDILHRLSMAINTIRNTQGKVEQENPRSLVCIQKLEMKVFPHLTEEGTRGFKVSARYAIEPKE